MSSIDRRQLPGRRRRRLGFAGLARPRAGRRAAAASLRPSRARRRSRSARRAATSPRPGRRRTAPRSSGRPSTPAPCRSGCSARRRLARDHGRCRLRRSTRRRCRAPPTLFEPLDDYLKRDPIEDCRRHLPRPDGGHEGRRQAARDPVPPRLLGPALQRGDPGREGLLEAAGDDRGDGRDRPGLHLSPRRRHGRASASCMPGVTYPNVIDIARAWDGDFITPDFKMRRRPAADAERHQAPARPLPGRRLPAQFRDALDRGRRTSGCSRAAPR